MRHSLTFKILVFLFLATPAFAQGIRVSSPSQHPLRHRAETLLSSCTDAEVLGGNAAGTGVECQADAGGVGSGDIERVGDCVSGECLITGGNITATTVTVSGLTTMSGLIATTSFQNNSLVNCDTIDTDGSGIFACGTDATGAGGGDAITVDASAVDTTAAFTDNTEIGFTLVDGGAGGPDTVTADVIDDTLDFTEFAGTMALDEETTIGTGANALIFQCDNPGFGCFDVNGSGAFTGDLLHVHQHTGNSGAGNLIHAESVDMDIDPLVHINMDAADITADTVGLLIDAVDDDDANYIPLEIRDDVDVANDLLFKIDSTGSVTTGIWNAGAVTSSGLTSATGLLVTTSLQDTALANCDTIDTNGSGIFSCGTDNRDTKCLWFEDPTADDDFKSIWANKTANDFQVTEIWAESDQTVTFMLQLDDGSPADMDTVDLAPAAGEAEDTSLNGDALVAAGEEIDLATTSVANTPTWVSICWTGNWVD